MERIIQEANEFGGDRSGEDWTSVNGVEYQVGYETNGSAVYFADWFRREDVRR